MIAFFQNYKIEIIQSSILLIALLIIRGIIGFTVHKIGKRSGTSRARAKLIIRYATASLVLVGLLMATLIFGAKTQDIVLVFSSVFAVIGIALFAIWSILSNITSGVIMFFSFPYKVGDKIEIHDKDFPVKAIIEDIRAFQLFLRDDTGNLITYPNNLILQKPVTLIQKGAFDG